MNIYVSVENNKVKNYQIGSSSDSENLLIPSEYSLIDLPFLTITDSIEMIEVLNPDTQILESIETITKNIVLDESAKNALILAKQEEVAMKNIRQQRDQLLKESDFSQLSDAPLSIQQKADYVTYRQALRDLPENIIDVMNPIFPSKPE